MRNKIRNILRESSDDKVLDFIRSKYLTHHLGDSQHLELDFEKWGLTSFPEIPDELFKKLESFDVVIIYLDGNNLTTLPRFISALDNVSVLYLDGNPITELPDMGPKYLGTLHALRTGISDIPNFLINSQENRKEAYLSIKTISQEMINFINEGGSIEFDPENSEVRFDNVDQVLVSLTDEVNALFYDMGNDTSITIWANPRDVMAHHHSYARVQAKHGDLISVMTIFTMESWMTRNTVKLLDVFSGDREMATNYMNLIQSWDEHNIEIANEILKAHAK